MNDKQRLALLVLIVLCAGLIFLLAYRWNLSRDAQQEIVLRPPTDQTSQPEPTPTPVSEIVAPAVYKDLIEILSPLPNAVVTFTSPVTKLEIKGRARGTWFFEGSFPVKLVNESGILATGIAQADGEWMTSDFVSFTAKLTIPLTSTEALNAGGSASIILKKDNPSGESMYDDEFAVPIFLAP